MNFPAPVIRRRAIDPTLHAAAIEAGYTPLQAHLLAARLPARYAHHLREHITPSLKHLDPPDLLPDIAIITRLIADAVMDPVQRLAILGDHDVDGSSASAVLRIALVDHFGMDAARVGIVLSHKRKEGFGVSDKFVERLIREFPPPALLCTVDQGSGDSLRFLKLRELSYQIAVTDHHHIDAVPDGVEACVNPSRTDSLFADHRISGCFVAWLVACSVRRELIARGHLPADAPSLACLLDLVANSVVADSTSLAHSINNRAVLRYGLQRMNRAPRAVWLAMREVIGKEGDFDEQDIAFQCAPRCNGISRMGDAMPIVDFLTATDPVEATRLAEFADGQNQQRKAAEKIMVEEALRIAEPQVAAGRHAIVVHLVEGSSGIHGVVASRVVEKTGRPVMCLSPKYGEDGMLTGSMRSVQGIDVLQALTCALKDDPDCAISFGGHAAAAGILLRLDQLERLTKAFDDAVGAQRDLSRAAPQVLTDGMIDQPIDLMLLDEIAAIGPFGREFEAPCFEMDACVQAVKPIGDGTHLRVELIGSDRRSLNAVWFGALKAGEPLPICQGQHVHFVFTLARNVFRGKARADVHIRLAFPIQEQAA